MRSLASLERAEVEREARRFADAQGYAVEWERSARLDDEMLVNGIAQIAPFDVGRETGVARGDADRRRAPNWSSS